MAKTISNLNKGQKKIINDEMDERNVVSFGELIEDIDFNLSEDIIDRIEALEQGAAGSEELLTTDKTIVGAINELFQSANNGKQLIANAIGEPVSAEDTFSAMSDKINVMKSDLKQVLTEEGVSVTEEDDMASLISKVEQRLEEGEVFKEGTTNCIDLSMLPYRHHNYDGTLSTQITTRLFTFLNKGTVTFKFNITGWSNTVYAMVYLEQYNVNHELVYRSDLFSAQGSDRTNACSVTMTVSKGDYVFIVPHSSSEGGYISDMKMYYD